MEANRNCERQEEALTPARASFLTIQISFYGSADCDSTICISVCSHIYLTNLFAATGKYNPSVIRERSTVLINQANISRPLALYAIRTVLSCLVICYPSLSIRRYTSTEGRQSHLRAVPARSPKSTSMKNDATLDAFGRPFIPLIPLPILSHLNEGLSR